MSETLIDLSVVCLVCLRGEDIYCSIFSNDPETPEHKILDKIEYCSNLNLPEEILQKVPDRICALCLEELCATWRFRNKCDRANQLYQSMHKQDLEAEALANATLEEHNVKLPAGVRVKCVNALNLTLKLPSKVKQEPPESNEDVEFVESTKNNNQIIKDEPPELPMPMPPVLKVFKSNNESSVYSTDNVNAKQDSDEEEQDEDEKKAPMTPQHTESRVYRTDNDNAKQESDEEEQDEDEDTDSNYDVQEFFELLDDDDDVGGLTIDDHADNDDEVISVVSDDAGEQFPVPIQTPKMLPKTPKSKKTALVNQVESQISSKLSIHQMNAIVDAATANEPEHIKPKPIAATTTTPTTTTTAAIITAAPVKQRRATTALDNLRERDYSVCVSKRKKVAAKRPLKICDICGNTYKYQHALNAHMRRHNNERPYPCEVCNKAFVSNVELRRHMRVHTGQKPYACSYCDRRFSDFGSSKKHERIHTGERPYVCDVCNKGFAYAHVLTVHKRTHTGEKQFPCPHCTKGFTKKVYLAAHIEQHRRAAKRSSQFSGIIRDVELNKREVAPEHNEDDDDDEHDNNNAHNRNDHELHGIGAGILLKVENDDGNNTLNAVVSVFEDDKVLEECIVTSDFMTDGGDGDCLGPDSATGDHGVVYDVQLSTDFLDSEDLDKVY